jgi:hypothetical protein
LCKRLGIDRLDFCAPCLKECLFEESGGESLDRGEILEYIRRLRSICGKAPPKRYGQRMKDLIDLPDETRLQLLRLLRHKPSQERVAELFGSWRRAVVEAGCG